MTKPEKKAPAKKAPAKARAVRKKAAAAPSAERERRERRNGHVPLVVIDSDENGGDECWYDMVLRTQCGAIRVATSVLATNRRDALECIRQELSFGVMRIQFHPDAAPIYLYCDPGFLLIEDVFLAPEATA